GRRPGTCATRLGVDHRPQRPSSDRALAVELSGPVGSQREAGAVFLPPLHGEGGREATGWGGLGDPSAALVLACRPHPSSAFGLSHPPHEGEGEGCAFLWLTAAGSYPFCGP